MGLFKRGEIWWLRFNYDGQQIRRSTETTDKKLAQRIFDKLKGEVAEGKWFARVPGEHCKFEDLMEKYMLEYSAVNKAASTHKRDKSLVKQLQSVFGEKYLTDITPAMISDFKVKRRKDGVSPRTINYELTTMSHAFNLAIREWGLASDNPVMKVKKDRVSNAIERWLTMEEEKKLLQSSPEWLQDIIVFAIHTGLRQSEILDLKWSQVDMNRRTITILEQKNRGVDTLPVNETTMSVLRKRYRAEAHLDSHVFPNTMSARKGNRLLLKAFHAALKKSGVRNFRFHDLRHLCNTVDSERSRSLYTSEIRQMEDSDDGSEICSPSP